MRPRFLSSCFLALVLAAASVASADPIVTAYTHRSDVLYLLELTGDDVPVLPQPVGMTGASFVCALAEGPGESFFAAVSGGLQGPDELWLIDPQTLSSVAVGELGVNLGYFADLAGDGSGLWLAADDTLHSVDTMTGQATAIGAAADLATTAFDGSTLFGISGSASSWTLVTVDPATGDQTAAADLDFAMNFNGLLLTGPRAMDFDDFGGLWALVFYENFGIPDPPFPEQVIYYFADPLSGSADSLSPLPFSQPWSSLAISSTTLPAVDVPVLGAGGLAVLALLLASTALIAMRRRFAGREQPLDVRKN